MTFLLYNWQIVYEHFGALVDTAGFYYLVDGLSSENIHRYWWNQVPETNRSWYVDLRIIPYERIIAVDDIGDRFYRGIHLLVEYEPNGQPFKSRARRQLIESYMHPRDILDVREGKHISYFPNEIPEITLDSQI
jgi:hypothetical protein